MHQLRKVHWTERFQKSPYFLGAFLFHLLIGLFSAAYIVLPAPPPPKPEDPVTILIPPMQGEEAPQRLNDTALTENQIENGTPSETVSIPIPTSGGPDSPLESMTHVNTPTDFNLNLAKAEMKPGEVGSILEQTKGETIRQVDLLKTKTEDQRRDFYKKWYDHDGSSESKKTAVFTVYVAKVEGLNAQKLLQNEKGIDGGPLHNLMKIAEGWSHQTMKAKVSPDPLNLADETLIDRAPPFLFFSGSRDFKLTEKEVSNLQRYLAAGGAIWADNGLAGSGSRFDIAFRREMKRVVGHLNFEVLPLEHPIFQGPKSLIQIGSIPEGMNYRQEPIEVIKIDGEIAVVYTPNNYTDMMRMVFQEPLRFKGNQALIFERNNDKNNTVASTPLSLWRERETFFRNFQPGSSEQVFRLGTNLIFHLITRWQDRLG
jgi:hypothetical protein